MTWVIVGSFIGFVVLAAVLLVPVYNLLQREARKNDGGDTGAD